SAAALLGWLGWPMVLFGLLVALSAAAVVSLLLLAARRIRWAGHLPFGPFLVLGTLTALALAA
ncbi:MAG TPA: prepilin peptidase, partial [Micromonospora sp.]